MNHLLSRRQWLSQGLAGLTLPMVLELARANPAQVHGTEGRAVIFISLGGGASHHETFDPKPQAPPEVRGAFESIPTRLPGVRFCELLPRLASQADRLAVIRSVTHHEASHIALHMVETGYYLQNISNALRGEMPAMGSVVARVRGRQEGLPAFVSIPRPQAYTGPQYLGGQYQYFPINQDPNDPDFRVNNLELLPNLTLTQLEDRQAMLRNFDGVRSQVDQAGTLESMDAFQRQAMDLLTGEKARKAVDLNQEPARLRDRYGRTTIGQRLLLARRLVEAGVPWISVRTFDWDDHQDLAAKMKARCPSFDQAVAALIGDLQDRGLDRDVLVAAMGEFGRTPRVNPMAGRDHWPSVMSVLLAGGDYRMGQVIGASDNQGAQVRDRPFQPQQVQGMVYRHLGIDPGLTFQDPTGRPRHLLEKRDVIPELVS